MTKFIPILPLSIVVYPGQKLNLHIFEPRYKQLIQECLTEHKTFGIPSSFKGALNECGTEMRLLEISKTYANGEMDIKTEGIMVFKLIEIIREIPNKLYSAAIVYEMPPLSFDTAVLNPTIIDLMEELHTLLGTKFDIFQKIKSPLSYDIVPYIAMSPEDQYRLLLAESEKARQYFIIQHLQRLIPVLIAAEATRVKVKMNGHFRKEKPPEF